MARSVNQVLHLVVLDDKGQTSANGGMGDAELLNTIDANPKAKRISKAEGRLLARGLYRAAEKARLPRQIVSRDSALNTKAI